MSEQSALEKIPVLARKLRELREGRGWTRQDLAEKMKGNGYTSNRHIQRAENCEKGVSLVFYRRIAEGLGTTLEELLESAVPPWNVPHAQNPFFTGREEVLAQLRQRLAGGGVALTQSYAVSGLGGIGKTQLAVEYAYRYRQHYKAVLWTQADSCDNLVSGFVAMANRLNLPQTGAADQNVVVTAVKEWLEHTAGWLLIFDNADTPEWVKAFMPRAPQGHILLTSRAQVFDILGIGNAIQLEKIRPDEAVEFLLKRTGRSCPEISEIEAAGQLAAELDYLPLALEQAGAYMVRLRCCFRDYLACYRKRGLELLERVRAMAGEYPFSVATAWQLNFEQVRAKSAASADLLRMSAFLYPDSIPLELFVLGKVVLSPALSEALAGVDENPLVLDEVLEPLIQYSLIRRDPGARTYSIHRLVQGVLQAGMTEAERRQWANHAVQAVSCAFPPAEFHFWNLCEGLLPHVQACAELVEKWELGSGESARLFHRAGHYLHQRGRWDEAEGLYRQSLAICERILGPNHPNTAESLQELGVLLAMRNRPAEAEPMLKRSLEIREEALGPDHPDTARILNRLAGFFRGLGKCMDEAERLMKRGLTIQENLFGTDHPDTVGSLEELGLFYCSQKRFPEAEALYQRVLTLREKTLGSEHPDTGQILGMLGGFYYEQGKFVEAERYIKRGLEIQQQTLGPENLFTGLTAGGLARLYHAQGKFTEAERLYRDSLATIEKSVGPANQNLIEGLKGYAALLRAVGRDDEAIALENRAGAIQAQRENCK